MGKIKKSVVFKEYNPGQLLFLPPSLEELIPEAHLVRVVDQVVDRMDMSDLMNLYEGGGTSAYHPRMLLKVLLYAYCIKIYTGRKIARALGQDIHFFWLSGMSRPDFRTINRFRSSKAKEVIEVLFSSMLVFLMEHGYIKMENYFCDGSTFSADANKHKMVWKKNAHRYKASAEQKCQQLLKEIDALNAAEELDYGNKDLEEYGLAPISGQVLVGQIEQINEKIKSISSKKAKRKAQSLGKQLKGTVDRIDKYEQQIRTAGSRSGYNVTDPDASAMLMKNKVEVLPAYNVLAGCEDQFITGISLHQNTNDGTCFKDHLDQLSVQQPVTPENIVADSIFGTEENYELLENKGINNYLKFPQFHNEQKKKYQNNPFLKENFCYDPAADSYTCPNKQQLTFRSSYKHTHKRTGYQSQIKEYECTDCAGCPFYDRCCKSAQGNNRTLKVNEQLDQYKQQARDNLNSQKGFELRKRRSIEIESCFGDIKANMGFRRFHLRGLKKVTTEFTLVAMAHNLRKLYFKQQKAVA
jgi:transposase